MHIQEPEPKQRETRCKFICRPNGKRWTVLWYVVVRPKRLLTVCGEQSPPHSGKVSNATPYLWLKSSRGQEHGGTKPVKALTPGARGPGSEAVYGKGSIA